MGYRTFRLGIALGLLWGLPGGAALSAAQARATTPVDTLFAAYLVHLERSLTAFTQRLPEAVDRIRAAAPQPLRPDSLFLAFQHQYFQLANSLGYDVGPGVPYTEKGLFFNLPAQRALRDSNAYRQVHELVTAHGFDLARHEGDHTIRGRTAFLQTTFGPYLSPASQAFLAQRSAEEQRQFSDDAIMLISWDQLADRIAAWEQMVTTYGDFALRPQAEAWHRLYLRTYFTGLHHTPPYDFDTRQLKAEARASYQRSIERYGHMQWGLLLGEYWALLKDNDYRVGSEADQFLETHAIQSMRGLEPPLR